MNVNALEKQLVVFDEQLKALEKTLDKNNPSFIATCNKIVEISVKRAIKKCLIDYSNQKEELAKIKPTLSKNDYKIKKIELNLKHQSLLTKSCEEINRVKLCKPAILNLEQYIFKMKTKKVHLEDKLKRVNHIIEYKTLDKDLKKEKQTDLSFYRPDKLSSLFILLATITQIYYTTSVIPLVPTNLSMALVVLGNILVLLFLFTCVIKIKVYKISWTYVCGVIFLYQFLRLFYIIPHVYDASKKLYNEQLKTVDPTNLQQINNLNRNLGIIDKVNASVIVFTVLILVGIIISFIKIQRQKNYIKAGKISFNQMSK